MNKHAYLIIAHRIDYTFYTLLRMIDDSRNDIFIHIDKKTSFTCSDILSKVSRSTVFILDNRISVTWGDLSQITCELMLFEKATQIDRYKYYHLISGQDLPIKSQDYIHEFFSSSNLEYIGFEREKFIYADRVQYYHFLQPLIGRKDSLIKRSINKIETLSLSIQKAIGIERFPNGLFQKGTNWVSVTDAYAQSLVRAKNTILKQYRWTLCCDEVYKQSFALDNGYEKKCYKYDNKYCNMRKIDWKRGCPYTWRSSNINELLESSCLFARKFDSTVDKDIIDLVYSKIMQRE